MSLTPPLFPPYYNAPFTPLEWIPLPYGCLEISAEGTARFVTVGGWINPVIGMAMFNAIIQMRNALPGVFAVLNEDNLKLRKRIDELSTEVDRLGGEEGTAFNLLVNVEPLQVLDYFPTAFQISVTDEYHDLGTLKYQDGKPEVDGCLASFFPWESVQTGYQFLSVIYIATRVQRFQIGWMAAENVRFAGQITLLEARIADYRVTANLSELRDSPSVTSLHDDSEAEDLPVSTFYVDFRHAMRQFTENVVAGLPLFREKMEQLLQRENVDWDQVHEALQDIQEPFNSKEKVILKTLRGFLGRSSKGSVEQFLVELGKKQTFLSGNFEEVLALGNSERGNLLLKEQIEALKPEDQDNEEIHAEVIGRVQQLALHDLLMAAGRLSQLLKKKVQRTDLLDTAVKGLTEQIFDKERGQFIKWARETVTYISGNDQLVIHLLDCFVLIVNSDPASLSRMITFLQEKPLNGDAKVWSAIAEVWATSSDPAAKVRAIPEEIVEQLLDKIETPQFAQAVWRCFVDMDFNLELATRALSLLVKHNVWPEVWTESIQGGITAILRECSTVTIPDGFAGDVFAIWQAFQGHIEPSESRALLTGNIALWFFETVVVKGMSLDKVQKGCEMLVKELKTNGEHWQNTQESLIAAQTVIQLALRAVIWSFENLLKQGRTSEQIISVLDRCTFGILEAQIQMKEVFRRFRSRNPLFAEQLTDMYRLFDDPQCRLALKMYLEYHFDQELFELKEKCQAFLSNRDEKKALQSCFICPEEIKERIVGGETLDPFLIALRIHNYVEVQMLKALQQHWKALKKKPDFQFLTLLTRQVRVPFTIDDPFCREMKSTRYAYEARLIFDGEIPGTKGRSFHPFEPPLFMEGIIREKALFPAVEELGTIATDLFRHDIDCTPLFPLMSELDREQHIRKIPPFIRNVLENGQSASANHKIFSVITLWKMIVAEYSGLSELVPDELQKMYPLLNIATRRVLQIPGLSETVREQLTAQQKIALEMMVNRAR